MGLVFLPRHYDRQSEMYHQLAAMTAAGVGVIEACDYLRQAPPHPSFRDPFTKIIEELRAGRTFAEAVRGRRKWLPDFDLSLIEASEISGRLDACFRMLSDFYAERARLIRRVLSELTWPLFTLHMAILVFPTSTLVGFLLQGKSTEFLVQKALVIVPLYAFVGAFILAGQSRHGERWRSLMEQVLHPVPLLGQARGDLALARLSAALEALLSAGVPILDAWLVAAKTCGSLALRSAIRNWTPPLKGGATPGELLLRTPIFPSVFSSLYHTAELSGQIDQTLRRLYTMFAEEASRKFQAFSQWLPRLIMLAIMLGIAFQVVSFWLNYFNTVGNAIGP